jgi:photosynthetic reaction center cytochrome c subunit
MSDATEPFLSRKLGPNLGIGNALLLVGAVAAALMTVVIVTSFDRPRPTTIQHGFRGVAMGLVYNPREVQAYLADNQIPASLPQLPAAGPKAGAVYKNVKVLQSLSVGQFTRLMASITQWVAPQAGCAYCHNTANMADDSLYTKVVARRMIQMVQHINADWKPHVAATGVTCYTCHRGMPVPANIWFTDPLPVHFQGMAETQTGLGHPTAAIGDTALPYDPFTPYLQHDTNIRVQAMQALPGTDRHSIFETEWTYALMIHFSQALGVNCTYCHNSRAFEDWSQSTPQRITAWHGIRMVRDLNDNYLTSLNGVFPPARLGPHADVPKVNCATCHNGVYKPLFGVSMVTTFPELQGPTTP